MVTYGACFGLSRSIYLLKAIELGVAAYVRKPVDTDELLAVIAKAALPGLQRRQIRGLSGEQTQPIG